MTELINQFDHYPTWLTGLAAIGAISTLTIWCILARYAVLCVYSFWYTLGRPAIIPHYCARCSLQVSHDAPPHPCPRCGLYLD